MPKKTTRKKSTVKSETMNFETSLKELETLVERMEKGDLSLEESLHDFERGVELTRECQQALKAAEQKVQKLIGKGDKAELGSFDDD